MTPILYKTDASPPARAVMMIVDILGLKVDEQELNPILRQQDTPEFKKKNPMRTIPILEEGDFYLADSHAIMLYLIDKYGKPEHAHLYPSEKRKRATINQRLFFDCGVLFPRLRAVMAPTYAGKLAELNRNMIKNIEDAYSIMESYLTENLYLADEVVTVADISAITTISSLNGLYPVDEKSKWINRMNDKEYCRKINTPGSELHVAGLIALMDNTKHNQQSKL
ncbi:glutathione S-transferase epsilon 6 [Bombyx mori]|uniref:Glutathione S-transferase 12 n=1 Tax=Bombyx mori TaxID=7091 RepID=B0LKP5_BOMMO|nr:glutathione S-transferase epsilon 6 [Bombyx mori]ABY66600.1 glutathione S-transferase 12 [Bombyx mori]